jgi:hypothetical protein
VTIAISDGRAQAVNGDKVRGARLLQAVGRGESLPPSWYTDPAITALEIIEGARLL